MKSCIFSMVLVAFTWATAANARTDTRLDTALRGRYFLVVWGYQGQNNDVVESHTFASFYKGEQLAHGKLNPPTISWLPFTGVVHLFGIEKGRNFSLTQTLGMACRAGRDVEFWGPYEIRPELYRSGLRRIRLLNSGRVTYSMIDIFPGTMNCIDAAGDIVPAPLDTGISWGFAASSDIVQHLSPYFKNGGKTVKALTNLPFLETCNKSMSIGDARP
ncbi:MAG: hypothetical protein AB7S74_17450 [Hyphomicrobium sp.]